MAHELWSPWNQSQIYYIEFGETFIRYSFFCNFLDNEIHKHACAESYCSCSKNLTWPLNVWLLYGAESDKNKMFTNDLKLIKTVKIWKKHIKKPKSFSDIRSAITFACILNSPAYNNVATTIYTHISFLKTRVISFEIIPVGFHPPVLSVKYDSQLFWTRVTVSITNRRLTRCVNVNVFFKRKKKQKPYLQTLSLWVRPLVRTSHGNDVI